MAQNDPEALQGQYIYIKLAQAFFKELGSPTWGLLSVVQQLTKLYIAQELIHVVMRGEEVPSQLPQAMAAAAAAVRSDLLKEGTVLPPPNKIFHKRHSVRMCPISCLPEAARGVCAMIPCTMSKQGHSGGNSALADLLRALCGFCQDPVTDAEEKGLLVVLTMSQIQPGCVVVISPLLAEDPKIVTEQEVQSGKERLAAFLAKEAEAWDSVLRRERHLFTEAAKQTVTEALGREPAPEQLEAAKGGRCSTNKRAVPASKDKQKRKTSSTVDSPAQPREKRPRQEKTSVKPMQKVSPEGSEHCGGKETAHDFPGEVEELQALLAESREAVQSHEDANAELLEALAKAEEVAARRKAKLKERKERSGASAKALKKEMKKLKEEHAAALKVQTETEVKQRLAEAEAEIARADRAAAEFQMEQLRSLLRQHGIQVPQEQDSLWTEAFGFDAAPVDEKQELISPPPPAPDSSPLEDDKKFVTPRHRIKGKQTIGMPPRKLVRAPSDVATDAAQLASAEITTTALPRPALCTSAAAEAMEEVPAGLAR